MPMLLPRIQLKSRAHAQRKKARKKAKKEAARAGMSVPQDRDESDLPETSRLSKLVRKRVRQKAKKEVAHCEGPQRID